MKTKTDTGHTEPPRPPFIGAVVLFFCLFGLEMAWGRWAPPFFPSGITGTLLLTASARGLDLALVVFFCRVGRVSADQLGLAEAGWVEGLRRGVIWSVLLGCFALAGFVAAWTVSGRLPVLLSYHHAWFHLPWPGVLSLSLLVLVGPVTEEIVFRGILYNAFRRRFSFPAALLFSVVLFATAHGPDPKHFLPAVAGALVFCISFERSKSLWTPIVIHVSGNAFLWLYGFFTLSGFRIP